MASARRFRFSGRRARDATLAFIGLAVLLVALVAGVISQAEDSWRESHTHRGVMAPTELFPRPR